MSQFKVLLLSSLPLLGIFIMGLISCILLLRLDEELEQRKKEEVARSAHAQGVQMSDLTNESEQDDPENPEPNNE